MICLSSGRLGNMLGKHLSGAVPTDDGKGFTLTLAKTTGITIWPQQDKIVVHDDSVKVGSLTVKLVNGMLSVEDQTMMLGQIQRIMIAKRTGGDPITGTLDLGSMPKQPVDDTV